jgi:tetratricopeptide (TPR) repeat protein
MVTSRKQELAVSSSSTNTARSQRPRLLNALRIVGIIGLTAFGLSMEARSAQPVPPSNGCQPAGAEIQLSNCTASIRSSALELSNSLIARGNAFRESGKLDQALQDLTQAINLTPYYVTPLPCMPGSAPGSAFAYRGLAFEAKGQLDLAKKDYLSALRASPVPTSSGKNSQQIAMERLAALDSLPEVRPIPNSGPPKNPDAQAANTSRPSC